MTKEARVRIFANTCKEFFDWDKIIARTYNTPGKGIEKYILIDYMEQRYRREVLGEIVIDYMPYQLVDYFTICRLNDSLLFDKDFRALIEKKLEMPIDEIIRKYIIDFSDNEEFDNDFMDRVSELIRMHIENVLKDKIKHRKEDIVEELNNRKDIDNSEYIEKLIKTYLN